jgi:hypothetical protein
MLAQWLTLLVLETDEDSSMPNAWSVSVPNLIEDELETEETHLKDTVVRIPIQQEAKVLRVVPQ